MAKQAKFLKAVFTDDASAQYDSNELTWEGNLTPSPLSQTYRVKVYLRKGKRPKIFVLEPKLQIPEGKKLPHVYSKNDLCLYYPNGNEWNEEKFLVQTIIPWTSEWLYHYEIWLTTGKWNGGGIHPPTNKKLSK